MPLDKVRLPEEADKPEPEHGPRKHTVIWDREDWERLQAAAQRLGDLTHLDVAVVDIIRSGARRRADEILADQPAAHGA